MIIQSSFLLSHPALSHKCKLSRSAFMLFFCIKLMLCQ